MQTRSASRHRWLRLLNFCGHGGSPRCTIRSGQLHPFGSDCQVPATFAMSKRIALAIVTHRPVGGRILIVNPGSQSGMVKPDA
jgi:hypothetical protein